MCDTVFSEIWRMEDYYDVTTVKREARKLLLTKDKLSSLTKSWSSDGVELTEMPLRYDR